MGETAMSPSTSTDMSDVDMASIAEVELSEKFSVQGTSTGTSGRKKVVSKDTKYFIYKISKIPFMKPCNKTLILCNVLLRPTNLRVQKSQFLLIFWY